MAKRRKDKQRGDRGKADAGSTESRKGKAGKPKQSRSWMDTHGKDLRFLLVFGLLMFVYYVVTTFDFVEHKFFPWYLEATAKVSTVLLTTCGYDDVERSGKNMKNPRGAISVARGCDALAPTALFVTAVLASPAGFRFKWRGLIAGILILMVANVLRIITLFLTRVHWQKAFDVMHLDIWQGLFILLAIFLWWQWAEWATRKATIELKAQSDAGT